MSLVSLYLVILLGTPRSRTACPVKNTIAYSRDTSAGIPTGDLAGGAPPQPISTSYFIYLVAGKGAPPSVRGIWLKGKYYTVTLRNVKSPVLIDHEPAVPTGKKDILVPATSYEVYELQLKNESSWNASNDDEKRLTQNSELVVFLRVGSSTHYCPVKTITRLPPVAGQ